MFKDGVTFTEEPILDLVEEIEPLIQKHWEEAAFYQDKIKLNPSWDKYNEMEKMGLFKVYTARDSDENLIGYCSFFIAENMHYMDHSFASEDVIYVSREKRNSRVGSQLLQYCEDKLKEQGVSVIVMNTKVHIPFDGLLERQGYNLQERIYSKYIGE